MVTIGNILFNVKKGQTYLKLSLEIQSAQLLQLYVNDRHITDAKIKYMYLDVVDNFPQVVSGFS